MFPRFRASAAPLRGHRAGEVRRLLVVRRRLSGRLHPRVSTENTPEHRVSAGERYAAVYEINLAHRISAVTARSLPFDAITMGHDYELSDYDRDDLIFTKEMLLAEPIERTAAAQRGRMSSVFFFIAAIGVLAGARSGAAARPVLRGAGAGRPPGLAGRAVPAAAGPVRGGGAGRRVRRRRDGAVRVRGRLRRRRGGGDRRTPARLLARQPRGDRWPPGCGASVPCWERRCWWSC